MSVSQRENGFELSAVVSPLNRAPEFRPVMECARYADMSMCQAQGPPPTGINPDVTAKDTIGQQVLVGILTLPLVPAAVKAAVFELRDVIADYRYLCAVELSGSVKKLGYSEIARSSLRCACGSEQRN